MRDWLFPALIVACVVGAVAYFGGLTEESRPRSAGRVAPPVSGEASAPISTEELRAACVEEIKSKRMPHYDEPSACHRYEDLTRGTLPPAPAQPPVAATPMPVAPQRSAEERRYATIWVEACTRFKRGSTEYRACRHQEAERLRKECAAKTWQANQASGTAREQLWREANAYCREQSRYRAVD